MTIELIIITALLQAVRNLVVEIREHLDPLASKANALLTTANAMAETVQERTERIADQAVRTSTTVGDGVQATSRVVERVVAVPVIKGSAAMAGLRRGVSIWQALRRERRDARANGRAA